MAVVESSVLQKQFPSRNCVWVPCIEATSATLLEILFIQLQVPAGDKQITLKKIISELDASKEPRLILLDNLRDAFEQQYPETGGGYFASAD